MTSLDRSAVDALLARARRAVDEGLLPDAATGLSFAYLANGRDMHFPREHRRTTALGSLAARCAA